MADLEQYLIARVLPSAYDARPGRPKPRFSEQQASQALAFLARQMNQDHTRDLVWWQIPRGAPTGPRMLASMLASGLLGAIVGGLGFVLNVIVVVVAHGVKQSLWVMLFWFLVQGLVFGLGVGLPLGIWFGRGDREPMQARTWRAISVPSVLTVGLVFGLVGPFVSMFPGDLSSRLVFHVNGLFLEVGGEHRRHLRCDQCGFRARPALVILEVIRCAGNATRRTVGVCVVIAHGCSRDGRNAGSGSG